MPILARNNRRVERKTLPHSNTVLPPNNSSNSNSSSNSNTSSVRSSNSRRYILGSISILLLVSIGTSISKLSSDESSQQQQQQQQQQQVSSTVDVRTIGGGSGSNAGLRITTKSSKSETVSADIIQSYAKQTKDAAVVFTDTVACKEAAQHSDAAAGHCIRYHPYIDLRDYLKHEEAIITQRHQPRHPNVLPPLLRDHPIQDNRAILTRCGYKGGTLASQINQDRAIIISPFLINGANAAVHHIPSSSSSSSRSFIMGIFDGHNALGHNVAQHTAQTLPKQLAKQLELIQSPHNDTSAVQNALRQSFLQVDATIPKNSRSSGCTASLLLRLDDDTIHVANTGDSQSYVAAHHRHTKNVQLVYRTRQDKPHLQDERARIEAAGGRVFIPPQQLRPSDGMVLSSRVIFPISPIEEVALAMSRSIGDFDGKAMGVIADPIVDSLDVRALKVAATTATTDSTLNDVELFAVSASDGLFDFIEPLAVAEILAKSLYQEEGDGHRAPTVMEACEQLIRQSSYLWNKEMQGGGYRDDITIAVTKIET